MNIILISVDALRSDHMGVYGYPKNTTPNIDKWAEDAFVFDNFRTTVPMTYPSFATLFTGLSPYDTRISDNKGESLNSNVNSLASILRDNGYMSAAFVTNGSQLENIFDSFNYYLHKFYYLDDENNERFMTDPTKDSKRVVGDASEWLDNNKNKKFLLWLHLVDPHTPYYPNQGLRCKFEKEYCDDLLTKTLEELDRRRAEYQLCQAKPVPNDRIEEMQALYDGEIATADQEIGRLIKKIEDLGLDKKSIIVFYSDHGEGFDHNYYFNHRGVLYDSAIKIPLIIKSPIIKSNNKKSNILIQNTDVLPTILDLLNIPKSDYQLEGYSFSNIINKGNILDFLPKKRKYSYAVNNNWTKFSIFDGRFKYIISLPGSCLLNGQKEELYDIIKDPNEMTNLIKGDTKKPELKKELLLYLSKYNLPSIRGSEDDYRDEEVWRNDKENNSAENLKSLGY